MSNPKYWAIIGGFWIFAMLFLWKFQMGSSEMNLTTIKIVISVVSLPIIAAIIWMMGSD